MSETIAVIGSGTMGSGIAQVAAGAGCQVILVDTDLDRPVAAIAKTRAILDRQVEKGKITESTVSELIGNIRPSADYADTARAALVIEAVFEDLATKESVITSIAQVAP